MTLTYQEWLDLGLKPNAHEWLAAGNRIQKIEVFKNLMETYSIKVRTTRNGSGAIGVFASKKEAEQVALTLRLSC